jgi:hypothetical protein
MYVLVAGCISPGTERNRVGPLPMHSTSAGGPISVMPTGGPFCSPSASLAPELYFGCTPTTRRPARRQQRGSDMFSHHDSNVAVAKCFPSAYPTTAPTGGPSCCPIASPTPEPSRLTPTTSSLRCDQAFLGRISQDYLEYVSELGCGARNPLQQHF